MESKTLNKIMDKDLQEKYKKISDEVDVDLSDIIDEFTKAIQSLSNQARFVRTRLLISFSLLEVVCGLYNSYYQLGLANRQLLLQFIEKYCFIATNKTFSTHPYFKDMTSEHLYKFRNSIIHAFALPEAENRISITVPNGSESAEVIKKMEAGFKKVGHKVIFISADGLTALFLDGFRTLHGEIFKVPSNATQEQFEGMERIRTEFTRRGSKPIPLA